MAAEPLLVVGKRKFQTAMSDTALRDLQEELEVGSTPNLTDDYRERVLLQPGEKWPVPPSSINPHLSIHWQGPP
jgi:hypothetical protein